MLICVYLIYVEAGCVLLPLVIVHSGCVYVTIITECILSTMVTLTVLFGNCYAIDTL